MNNQSNHPLCIDSLIELYSMVHRHMHNEDDINQEEMEKKFMIFTRQRGKRIDETGSIPLSFIICKKMNVMYKIVRMFEHVGLDNIETFTVWDSQNRIRKLIKRKKINILVVHSCKLTRLRTKFLKKIQSEIIYEWDDMDDKIEDADIVQIYEILAQLMDNNTLWIKPDFKSVKDSSLETIQNTLYYLHHENVCKIVECWNKELHISVIPMDVQSIIYLFMGNNHLVEIKDKQDIHQKIDKLCENLVI